MMKILSKKKCKCIRFDCSRALEKIEDISNYIDHLENTLTDDQRIQLYYGLEQCRTYVSSIKETLS